MTRTHWIVIAINVLAVALVGILALRGGGFTSGTFPPDTPVRIMQLVPVEGSAHAPVQERQTGPVQPAPPTDIDQPRVEPALTRWELGRDGRLRVHD